MQNEMTIDGQFITVWTSDFMDKNPCSAVNMTQAVKLLEGYDLTDDEKTSQPALCAGYARLLDEANLIGHGDTEFDAIADLFSHAKKV